ncbi:MAG TPA: Ppx/GppA phosphatase family protein [Gemmatales bacterium]|nr:Ppx/GppA phosphatase family protein [Gemmatales bacterium]HMP57870.1 Ppx/GppA phosphatase family protein [Gemmatales bacterium]
MAAEPVKRLAAIDIGSNSVRLMVVEASPQGDYRILDDHKETTRLAHGLATTGQLAQEAVIHTIDALRRMKSIVQGYQVDRLRVIATSAMRDADNRADCIRAVEQQTGLEIEIISATDEGEFSYRSVAAHYDLHDQHVLHCDLGGGSCELVFAALGNIEEIVSLPAGAVRLTEAYLQSDPPAKSELRALRKRVKKLYTEKVSEPTFLPHLMTGAGGTFSALANMVMRLRGLDERPVAGFALNRSEVRHVLDLLMMLPLAERRSVPGLHADRADIIIAGVAVIERLMKWLHINRLLVHDKGVRDGLIRAMIEEQFGRRTPGGDKLSPIEVIQQFGAACRYEPAHAGQVARLAGMLFDQLQQPLGLPPQERFLLESAAWLHEIGSLINYEKHHQHSYHLIKHGNLTGISTQQRELIANIARYHRKAEPKSKHAAYGRLAPAEQAAVRRMSALLRVADGLDRSHTQRIRGVQAQVDNGTVRIEVQSTTEPEVDLWGATQKGRLFERVFDRKLELVWSPCPEAADAAEPQPELAGRST